jgi:superfamily I DNA and RNA helicase
MDKTLSSKIDYQQVLNPAQIQAVMTTEGPLLVIAGAGSGKTRTLIYRVAHLVEIGTIPQKILLLTFTRKASGEMLERATVPTWKRSSRPWPRTCKSNAAPSAFRNGPPWPPF